MDNNDQNTVNESNPFYGKRIIFDSFLSDQEEDQYAYWRSLSGEQRLALATRLTQALYRNTPKTHWDKRIHFHSE